ncbi:MAG: endonuclease/exonuclease/phosphatase family protein, partial [Clostridiaceae bacterium]
MKIISWNVNGLRAIMKKDFAENVQKMDPDVLFLQEVKMQKDQVTEEMELREAGYTFEIFSGERTGYSGVAVYSRVK